MKGKYTQFFFLLGILIFALLGKTLELTFSQALSDNSTTREGMFIYRSIFNLTPRLE